MKNKLLLFFLFFTILFYAQNDTISVVKHTDKDLVVNKKSKIAYRGMINSLSIEVPNCKSFTASADGLKMVTKNLYNFSPGVNAEVIITIDIVLKNNKMKVEKHLFEIKTMSGFVTTINGRSGIVRMQKKQFLDATIKVIFEDKNLTFSNNVTGFSLKIPGLPSIEIIGNKIV